MCGISGFTHDKSVQYCEEVLHKMGEYLRHRGPDDDGYYITANIALGHRRLSIIDLKTGKQPIFNEDGSIAVILNGEIYNFATLAAMLSDRGHKLITSSDTEVLVHLYEDYGEQCLQHINGMFAFAIWDNRCHKLFIARDRMGQKPLYYTHFNNQLLFASELKALLQYPGVSSQIDLAALAKYLLYEYVPTPATIFRNIYKLPAGHYLTYHQQQLQIREYWDLHCQGRNVLSPREYCAQFEHLLRQAVELRLCSDVPLGVFLSGGIDSSSIVALMSELLPPEKIQTFSIGFSENSFDESTYAQQVAQYIGTNHHQQLLTPKAMLDILPKAMACYDEPFGDASSIPTYLLSEFTKQHVTVALGGDGGDELLAGYPTFVADIAAKYYMKLPRLLRKGIVEPLAFKLPVSTKNFSFDFKAKRFLQGMPFDPYIRQQVWLGSFTCEQLKSLLLNENHAQCRIEEIYNPIAEYQCKFAGNQLENILYLYAKFYLQDDILVKVDRASMAHSLEARAPFLDVNLVEFIAQMPLEWKMRGLTGKYILKKVARRKLPKNIINRPKKGFGIPIAQWLKKELKPLALELFSQKKIEAEGIFQYPYIKKLLAEHFSGKKDNRKQIWTLMAFEMWLERYFSKA